MTRTNVAEALRGSAALHDMLNLVGAEGKTDHDLAKLFTENEKQIGELLTFAIHELAGIT